MGAGALGLAAALLVSIPRLPVDLVDPADSVDSARLSFLSLIPPVFAQQSQSPPAPDPVEEPGPPAWQRHGLAIYQAGRRMKELAGERVERSRSESPDPFATLTAAEVTTRIASVRDDLEADLRQALPSPHPSYQTLEKLAMLRAAGAPAVPTVLSQMNRWEGRSGYHIPYVCASLKTLAQIAPADPIVITAATGILEGRPTQRGVCHTCGCALELLQQSGPAARPSAGPVLARAMRDPGFITTYDFQLGRALTAIGLSSGDATEQAIARALDRRPPDRSHVSADARHCPRRRRCSRRSIRISAPPRPRVRRSSRSARPRCRSPRRAIARCRRLHMRGR